MTDDDLLLDLARLMGRYGDNDRSRPGFAKWEPDLELGMRAVRVEFELAKREGRRWPSADLPDAERLSWLRIVRFAERFFRDQARQMRACEALGIPWLRAPGARPFAWCWEPRDKTSYDLTARVPNVEALRNAKSLPAGFGPALFEMPVVYPHDWARDEVEVDLYGFGDRWVPDEVLVISPEEIPVDGELLAAPPSPPETRERRRRNGRGMRVIEVEEVANVSEIEEPHATESTAVVPWSAPSAPERTRYLGSIEHGAFAPRGEFGDDL